MNDKHRAGRQEPDIASAKAEPQDPAHEVGERAVEEAARTYASAEHEHRRHRFELAVSRAACSNG